MGEVDKLDTLTSFLAEIIVGIIHVDDWHDYIHYLTIAD